MASGTDAGGYTTQIELIFSPEGEQLLKRIDAPIYTRLPAIYSEEWVASYIRIKEIAALYRPLRRALVAELVRSLVPPAEVMSFIESRITDQIQPQHQDKFKQDVLAELDHLDISRMGGLGITREQLEAWLNVRAK